MPVDSRAEFSHDDCVGLETIGYLEIFATRCLRDFKQGFLSFFLTLRAKSVNSNFMLTSALCTDFYQLTMAYGYFREGIADEEACFHLAFRKHPFKGGFTIAAGLETAAQYIVGYGFSPRELEYLSTLRDHANAPYFSQSFIDYLQDLKLTIDVDAVLEGTPVFPREPMLRIKGPLLQCQLLETQLLNIINFQSLVATKAARICLAADKSPVIDFGLRRAQGFDGALSATRAAFIGGVASTSNVFAGFHYGFPLSGTMAHSFVMCFAEEKEAFMAFARALPNSCILLTDTYNSLAGVKNAIEVGRELRSKGHDLAGIRLDSGDLLSLSKQSRRALDEAGFTKAIIVASNELDEYKILALKEAQAPIDVFGVGTRLITAFEEPALGGVYKLAAVKLAGTWQYRIKISDDHEKTTLPGILQVTRYEHNNQFVQDVIYDEENSAAQGREDYARNNLLQSIISHGSLHYEFPSLISLQARTSEQLHKLPKSILNLRWPKTYEVSLDSGLQARSEFMIKAELNG